MFIIINVNKESPVTFAIAAQGTEDVVRPQIMYFLHIYFTLKKVLRIAFYICFIGF